MGAACSGCEVGDELLVVNRLDRTVGLQIRAANERRRVDCDRPFTERFCAGDYVSQGVVDIRPFEERTLTLSDESDARRCARVVWLRALWLSVGPGPNDGAVYGPVDDPGTLLQLPAEVRVEVGPGPLHGIAFPGMTVRIDEVGTQDLNQGPPPPPCG